MTRYGVAFYGAPISLYGLDNTVISQDQKEGAQRKTRKNRLGKNDIPNPQ